ncbi:MAG: Uma2 family endonuclease [Planctomycetota bacterium]
MSWTETTTPAEEAPGGYRLGDPIPLEDFLALPPDGIRYERDDQGRLALKSLDHPEHHRLPMGRVLRVLYEALPEPWFILPEAGLGLSELHVLGGTELGPSRLGRRTLAPDLAVFTRRPGFLPGAPEGSEASWPVFSPDGLRLVIEILSPQTSPSDLGLGEADQIDRWRSYLASGVPEYWVLNVGAPGALAPRSGLFCAASGERWTALAGEGLRHGADPIHGVRPVTGGRIASQAIPGLVFDLDAFWRDCLD